MNHQSDYGYSTGAVSQRCIACGSMELNCCDGTMPTPPATNVTQLEHSRRKAPRFIVKATCAIAGSSLEGVEARLWFGASRPSAERATVRLKEVHGSYYRDWHIDEESAS